jgi:hypothetical protein
MASHVQSLNLGEHTDLRRQKPWLEAMESAINHLSQLWATEVSTSPWISETQVLTLLKHFFKDTKIIHHGSPMWLAPQHVDFYLPELRLAVECMGLQHYEPVCIFGGEEALRKTIERDERKRALCEAAGVSLEYIRFDDDVASRVKDIACRYGSRSGSVPAR